MDANEWIKALTSIGPFIVGAVAIVTWGLQSIFGRDGNARQTELLERIAAQIEKNHS